MKKVFRFLGATLLWLVITICLLITLLPSFFDRIYYQGPKSAHYDGQHFINPDGDDILRSPTGKSRGNFLLRWVMGTDGRAKWPNEVAVTPSRPAARVNGNQMVATWIGHATVLIQTNGLNILTDPIYSQRAGPYEFGPKRVTAPGVRFEDLPKVDIVLVSHNHYDHMDMDTIKRLWERDHPKIITSLGNDTVLGSTGATILASDWGGHFTIKPGVDVIITRNHHWGSRWGGDTGFGDGKWPVEASAYGPIRFAMIPIGAFRFTNGGMEIGSHIGPIKAERVFAALGASFAMPIHWGTFQLSNEARDTPPKMLSEVMKCAGYADQGRFAAHGIGEPVTIPVYKAYPSLSKPRDGCLEGSAITSLP
jgi:L-ascorbate metabolism protein UlaG (beta-lactamase superfamily)